MDGYNKPFKIIIQLRSLFRLFIKTWTHYCERHNIDFKVITEHDERYGFPIWNKLDIIDQIDNYDKFGIVDCDTMVKWDTPNIFDEIESGVSGVLDLAKYEMGL